MEGKGTKNRPNSGLFRYFKLAKLLNDCQWQANTIIEALEDGA
jgi:hypothetical protein